MKFVLPVCLLLVSNSNLHLKMWNRENSSIPAHGIANSDCRQNRADSTGSDY